MYFSTFYVCPTFHCSLTVLFTFDCCSIGLYIANTCKVYTFYMCPVSAAISLYVFAVQILYLSRLKNLVRVVFELPLIVKSGFIISILQFNKHLQSYCCPVQKNLTIKAKMAC